MTSYRLRWPDDTESTVTRADLLDQARAVGLITPILGGEVLFSTANCPKIPTTSEVGDWFDEHPPKPRPRGM